MNHTPKYGDSVTVYTNTGHPGPALITAVHEKNVIDVILPDGKRIEKLAHQDAGQENGWYVSESPTPLKRPTLVPKPAPFNDPPKPEPRIEFEKQETIPDPE